MVALRLHWITIHANKKAHRDGRLIRQIKNPTSLDLALSYPQRGPLGSFLDANVCFTSKAIYL